MQSQHKRARFSILTLLLITAIVALVLTVVQLYRDLSPLRTEVQQLREETGQLAISDPAALQAIGVETYSDWAWKWRIWIPAGKAYSVHYAASDIPPRREYPANTRSFDLPAEQEGREVVLTARIDRKPTGEFRLAISRGGMTSYLPVPEGASGWLTQGPKGSSHWGVAASQQTAKLEEPFVLVGMRAFMKSPTGSIPPTPEPDTTQGILVWMVEQD